MFLLSLVIFFPLLGGIALLFLPSNWLGAIRWTALGIAGVEFILSSVMALLAIQSSITLFSNSSIGGHLTWISAYGINYSLDVDGISLLLVLLTSLLTCICIAASFQIESKVKQYMAFMLLLECGILGVFLDFGCGAAGLVIVGLGVGGFAGEFEGTAPLILALGKQGP